ncbi:MAG: hypothetical protein HC880_10795 [Bacteroidia bacterium]|nr:hypothetical protein [Bacteroidia bacterium]
MSKKEKQDKKNTPEEEQPKKSSVRVSDKLQDFDIHINTFGEIISNYDVDKINEFLNKNVEDKKLKNRRDIASGESDPEEASDPSESTDQNEE